MRRSLLLIPMLLLAAPLAGRPAPPFFPAGAKFAVVQGGMGPFAITCVRAADDPRTAKR